jgi:hypothetical protein
MAQRSMQQPMNVTNAASRERAPAFAALRQQLGIKLIQMNRPQLLNADRPDVRLNVECVPLGIENSCCRWWRWC